MSTKKNAICFASILFALSSCSQDVENNSVESLNDVTFSIETESKMSGRLSSIDYTRYGRKLWSREAKHEVMLMSVFAFKEDSSGDYYFYPHESGQMWGDIYIPWTDMVSKKEYTIKPRLSAGKYKFIALGRDNGAPYYSEPYFDGVKFEDVTFSLASPMSEKFITKEAFVGSVVDPVVIEDNKGVKIDVSLNRMVAGVLGYFTNIPAEFNGKKATNIRIVAFEHMTTIVDPLNKEGLGTSWTKPGDEIIVDLSIPSSAEIDKNTGLYVFQQIEEGVEILPNSLLGGSFTLPKRNTTTTPTFKVELVSQDGQILKSWNARISGNSSLNYDIIANNFYSFGLKNMDNTTSPGNPGEEDKPLDLSRDQDLVISIDPVWGDNNDMEIE